MHCTVDQIQCANNTELSCVYLNLTYLLFCRLLCRFSMLWRTLLSGQSACRWGTDWKPTMAKHQGLAGQSCRSHWLIWKLPLSKNQHLTIHIPHETLSFVCKAIVENWLIVSIFLKTLIGGFPLKLQSQGAFTLRSNYRYKSTLCPQIGSLLNGPSSLNRKIFNCVGKAVIVYYGHA